MTPRRPMRRRYRNDRARVVGPRSLQAPFPGSFGRMASLLSSLFIVPLLIVPLLSCGNRSAGLDPVPPDAVGGLARTESVPEETTGTWNFSASIDSWKAHYGDGAGRRLTIHAFLFTTSTVAGDTYETSRRNIQGGGGGFTSAREARVAGVTGMRMTDAAGEYFEFRRGCWVLVLDGAAELFEPAIRGIRWEAAKTGP